MLHFPVTFCKNVCFNVKSYSPDLNGASPVFNLPKSPVKLLHIPSKTAALLLEAALRIHKHSSKKHANRFGSVLKKLSIKQHKQSHTEPQTTSFTKSASGSGKVMSDSDMEFCYSGRRIDDAVCSEDKSLDTDTSCSSSNSDLTRIFRSHPPSPSRRPVKDSDEEEKEQCSPVCVLDPPFEEDEDEDDHGDDDDDYGIVQRKKQQLLHKLSRFEALADLDPKDLEELILEDELYEDANLEFQEKYDDTASDTLSAPEDEILQQVLEKLGLHRLGKIPYDMKKLVLDLIADGEMEKELLDHTYDVVDTVCAKFESWKEVEQNTIDMMVGEDFRQETCKWKANKDELRLVAMDIELAIYASLVREVFI